MTKFRMSLTASGKKRLPTLRSVPTLFLPWVKAGSAGQTQRRECSECFCKSPGLHSSVVEWRLVSSCEVKVLDSIPSGAPCGDCLVLLQ